MFKKLFIIVLFIYSVLLHAQTHALVIGINNGNLIGAENDAYAMSQLLRHKKIQNIQTLYGRSATKNNILNAFNKIVNHAKSNDWVYLFFSGHGSSPFDPANRDKPKLRKRLKDTGALLSADNQLIVIKESLAPLFKKLDKRGVHTIVIFDACFSGMAYKQLPTQQQNFAFYTHRTTQKIKFPYRDLIFLSSSTYSDFSSENRKAKRGYFSKALTDCLTTNYLTKQLERCIDKKKIPQKAIFLPKKSLKLFPKYARKDITIVPYATLEEKRELFNLTLNSSKKFKLYAKDRSDNLSIDYSPKHQLTLYLDSEYKGYFALFMLGASGKLTLVFPNKKLKKIEKGSTTRLFSIKASNSFGEDKFVAFLLNKKGAKKLQRLYGELQQYRNIQEAIEIIKQNSIANSKIILKSHEK